MPIAALFFDLGGVVLSNGWDRRARSEVARQFDIPLPALEARHAAAAEDFECGRMALGAYLELVFAAPPGSSLAAAIWQAMQAKSQAYSPALHALQLLTQSPRLLLATLNNESAELNHYRIEAFGLRRYFRLFLSSCYMGVRKPEPRIYSLALELTQLAPEQCLVLDDRPENLAAAAELGMETLLISTPGDLRPLNARLGQAACFTPS